MRILVVDVETYSSVKLRDCGLYKYMESPDFSLLLTGFAFDDGPVTVIDHTQELPPQYLKDALYDPGVLKVAHNAAFEREAFRQHYGRYCPPEQWLDTMILAAVCGLPLDLDGACKALGFDSDTKKDAAGRNLIKLFSCPRKETKTRPGGRVYPKEYPEKWAQYIEYNRQDVVAERALLKALQEWIPDDTEHRLWCLDARLNEKGICIDRTLAENAVAMGNREKEELTEEAMQLTGLDNPNSVAQVKAWLEEQEGIEVPSLNKKAVAEVVAQLNTDKAKQFMSLRAKLAKSSIKKYDSMLRVTCDDGKARGCIQFYGAARTGRFAGRLIQIQNLPQNHMSDLAVARELVRAGDYDTVNVLYDSVSSTLSELIRTALVPEPGHRFVIADYSAIEARVTAWIAGEEWTLEAFRQGKDIYCETASQMFHVPVVKNGANGELRQKGKAAVLACGYGGGVGAIKNIGVAGDMTDEDMAEVVAMWRQSNPKICALWRNVERAAVRCVANKVSTEAAGGKVRFEYEKGILWMTLPSKRRIAYYGAQYGESRYKNGRALSYMGRDQKTGKWSRLETWGGKLVENLVQATARDCLKEAMLQLEEEGWDMRATVHDEIICTEPVDGRGWEDMAEVMCRIHPWEEGLPLAAAGYCCDFYQKD